MRPRYEWTESSAALADIAATKLATYKRRLSTREAATVMHEVKLFSTSGYMWRKFARGVEGEKCGVYGQRRMEKLSTTAIDPVNQLVVW